MVSCVGANGDVVKFELATEGSRGFLEVFQNGVPTSDFGKDFEGFDTVAVGSISAAVLSKYGNLKALEIDKDVSIVDNIFAEAGSDESRTAGEPRTRGPHERSNKITRNGARRDGDWPCDCGFRNFERRTECKGCGKSRRSDEEIERERIRNQFRRDGQFRAQARRQWKAF